MAEVELVDPLVVVAGEEEEDRVDRVDWAEVDSEVWVAVVVDLGRVGEVALEVWEGEVGVCLCNRPLVLLELVYNQSIFNVCLS